MATKPLFPTAQTRRRVLLAATVFATGLSVPAGAQAANVSFGPEITPLAATYIGITDYDSDTNDLTVTYQDLDGAPGQAGDRLVIEDTDPLVLDEPAGVPDYDQLCQQLTSFEIRCRVPLVESVTAFLGGADDKVTFIGPSQLANNAFGGAGDDEIRGGPSARDESFSGDAGDDRIYGSSAEDSMSGGEDNDTLEGRGGKDYLSGGLNADTLRGEEGPDRMTGGPGTDRVTYSERSTHVDADLQGDADDGGFGEGDQIEADVEDLEGGSEGDTLNGNGGPNLLLGGGGGDLLRGGTGPDVFDGGTGTSDTVTYSGFQVPVHVGIDAQAGDGIEGENDEVKPTVENVYGGLADDTLRGSAAPNSLYGGAGADTIEGRGGTDKLFGGDGADTMLAKDQTVDVLTCGSETDAVAFDEGIDALNDDCLAPVEPQQPPATPQVPDGADPKPAGNPESPGLGPALRIRSSRVRMSGRGFVRVKVSCPATAQGACRGVLRLARGKRGLGRRRVAVPAGKTATIRVKIARRHRASISLRPRRIKATARVRDAVSAARTSSRVLRLRSVSLRKR